MHFHFNFSAGEILWTLTFAGLLVLLFVLLGRDRARRFPWFTGTMALMALRLVAGRLLRPLPPMTSSEIFLVLSDLASILSILVVVEIARRAFKGAGRVAWVVGTLLVLAIGGVILAKWGPWPSWKTLTAGSQVSALRIMQLFAQKTDLLDDTLTIQLALLVALFGRRFHAGWRSHAQQIAIGLSTASMGQLAVRIIWQQIATHTTIKAQADYVRIMALQDKFYNANGVIFVAVLVWWIVCLWMDEPGSQTAAVASAEISGKAGAISSEAGEDEREVSGDEPSEEAAHTAHPRTDH